MTGKMSREGIIVRQGDSFDILLHFRKKDGSDFDITGCSLKMTVKKEKEETPIFTAEGIILDGLKGNAIIKLSPENTEVPVGDYVTDIELHLQNGDVHTIFPENLARTGIFRVTEDITGD